MHTLKKMYRYFLITLEHAIEGSWRNKVTTLSKFVNEEMTFSPCKIQGFSLRDFSFGRYSLAPWVLYACVWLEAWIVKKLLKVPLHVFKSPNSKWKGAVFWRPHVPQVASEGILSFAALCQGHLGRQGLVVFVSSPHLEFYFWCFRVAGCWQLTSGIERGIADQLEV